MDTEGLCTTSGGDLKVKHVIHVDVTNCATPEDWENLIKKSLAKAEELKLKSISFPALGTGSFDQSQKDMSAVMMTAIANFSKKKCKHLKTVRIVIFQQDMFDIYYNEMKSKKSGGIKDFLRDSYHIRDFMGMFAFEVRTGGIGCLTSLRINLSMFNVLSTAGIVPWPWTSTTDGESDVVEETPVHDSNPLTTTLSTRTTPTVASPLPLPQVLTSRFPRSIVFHIFAANNTDISAAINKIRQLCQQETKTKIIGSNEPQYAEVIKGFTPDQIDQVKAVENETPVQISIQRRNLIEIIGNSTSVHEAYTSVMKILHAIQLKQFEIRLMAEKVSWLHFAKGEYVKYSPEINIKLEEAYQNRERMVQLTNIPRVAVNLIEFKQYEPDGTTFRVIREDAQQAINLPATWSDMKHGDYYALVLLPEHSTEYLKVLDRFKDTIEGKSDLIEKVERIQNPTLYRQYMVRKDVLRVQNPPTVQNERILFHGTKPESIQGITTNGFNRSYHGANATVYGMGAYFAVKSSFSDDYSDEDKNGRKYMYMAKVLTGEYAIGNSSMRVPPAKDPKKPYILYDSVVNDMKNPGIFVVFKDDAAYPEYLITYFPKRT